MGVLKKSDVVRQYYKGRGPGGQNRNKVETGCRLTHKPTGLKVEVCVERTRSANEELAWELLQKKLDEFERERQASKAQCVYDSKPDASFGAQVRSYFLDGKDRRVVDHRTGVVERNVRKVLNGGISPFLSGERS